MVGSTPEGLPVRPMLRPGLRTVRRDRTRLQVGLGPDRLLVPDTAANRRLLADLAEGRPTPRGADVLAVCTALFGAGLLVDADEYRRSPLPGDAVAARYGQDPATAAVALARRRRARVYLDLPEPWREPAADLAARSGLRVTVRRHRATVTMLGAESELARERVDRLSTADQPHLLLSAADGRLTLGPFVSPGRSACLRCVDAHRAERDPRWPLVVEQYAWAPRAAMEPNDPALVWLALGWAVRELVTWADGGTPSLWSATVTIDAGLDLVPHRWSRHPHCGCCWDALATG